MVPDVPDGEFALKHEVFLLDANLQAPLDQTHMEPITQNLILSLLEVLGLVELGPLELYPATDLRAPGWSFLQPITTSHISGHYFEKPGKHPHLHMDIYSCDSIEWRKIVSVVDGHVGLADWQGSFVVRNWGDMDRQYIDLAGLGAEIKHERTFAPMPSKTPRRQRVVAGVR